MNQPIHAENLSADLKRPELVFYLSWISLSSLCMPLALLLSLIAMMVVTALVGDYVYVNGIQHITEDYLAMYVFVPVVGMVTGALQYGLLRQYLPRMGWWAPATVAGWLFGVFLVALPGWLGWANMPVNDLVLVFIVMGLAIGLSQWLVLRRRLARAGWWIAATALGWGLSGLLVGSSIDGAGLLLLGFLPACATAAMLALQMNRRPNWLEGGQNSV